MSVWEVVSLNPMPVVVKGDGSREPFDISKLERSLRGSGASAEVAAEVARRVAGTITDGMTTSEIYANAYRKLHKEERVLAARYSMRRAILEMGPTGFPFEDYFCALMRAKGYRASVRQTIKGRCAEHEVDVVLEKDGAKAGCELKFHNTPGFKTDLKTALYVRARFWDIEQHAEDCQKKCEISEGWLVTNTKFTGSAIRYASCAGIKLLGWSYPKEENLASIIRETGLYPITVLTTLSRKEEAALLAQQITLCKDVARDPEGLIRAGIPKKKHKDIIAESTQLCST